MNHLRFAAAVLLAATVAPAAVDPGLLDLVMPDAQVLAGMQVQRSLASPFGQYFLTQIPTNDGVSKFAAASVKDAIARHAAHATFGGPLAQQAQVASGANDVWITTLTPLAQFMKGANS